MLVTSGATVEEIWDYKVDGKSLDNMLAICKESSAHYQLREISDSYCAPVIDI